MLPDQMKTATIYLEYMAKRTPRMRKLVRSALCRSGGNVFTARRLVRRELVAREVDKLREKKRAARLARIAAGETVALRVVRRRRHIAK